MMLGGPPNELRRILSGKLRALPPDKQREAIDFVEHLHKKSSADKTPRRSLKGLWADLGLDLTDQDIADARTECWSNFPRENI